MFSSLTGKVSPFCPEGSQHLVTSLRVIKKKVVIFLWFSYGCVPGNKTEYILSANLTEEKFQENPIINWDAILWVNRPIELWVVQVVLAIISLVESLLLTYLGYKVSSNC